MNIKNIVKNIAGFREKTPLIGSIIVGVMLAVCLLGIVMPQSTNADFANNTNASYVAKATNDVQKVAKTIKVVITAYSSAPEETDDTPFTTASGKHVADGIVANNMLPMGTKIRIPSLYGDKVFVVEDRMNKRKSDYHIDIWMTSKPLAINFGVKTAEIEVLED
jgi:3D (Asp-Asp-Asp) domain-containing protein